MNMPNLEGLSESFKEALKTPYMRLYYATPESERWKLNLWKSLDENIYFVHKYSKQGDVTWTRTHYNYLKVSVQTVREKGHPLDAEEFIEAKLAEFRKKGIFTLSEGCSLDAAIKIGEHAEEAFKPKPTDN